MGQHQEYWLLSRTAHENQGWCIFWRQERNGHSHTLVQILTLSHSLSLKGNKRCYSVLKYGDTWHISFTHRDPWAESRSLKQIEVLWLFADFTWPDEDMEDRYTTFGEYAVHREVLDESRLDVVAQKGTWSTKPTAGEQMKDMLR